MANVSQHDVTFRERTQLGTLYLVDSIQRSHHVQGTRQEKASACFIQEPDKAEPWLPPVDLSALTETEQQAATQLLFEEAGAFAKDDKDWVLFLTCKCTYGFRTRHQFRKHTCLCPLPSTKKCGNTYKTSLNGNGLESLSHRTPPL